MKSNNIRSGDSPAQPEYESLSYALGNEKVVSPNLWATPTKLENLNDKENEALATPIFFNNVAKSNKTNPESKPEKANSGSVHPSPGYKSFPRPNGYEVCTPTPYRPSNLNPNQKLYFEEKTALLDEDEVLASSYKAAKIAGIIIGAMSGTISGTLIAKGLNILLEETNLETKVLLQVGNILFFGVLGGGLGGVMAKAGANAGEKLADYVATLSPG
ncbi:MAG: hypothetical protein ACK4PR_03515 [Gammaproteobacteria bacterium]